MFRPVKAVYKRQVIDPDTGKKTSKLTFEDKKKPPSKVSQGVREAPVHLVAGKLHKDCLLYTSSALAGGYRAAVYCRLSKDDDLQGESASIANPVSYTHLDVYKRQTSKS